MRLGSVPWTRGSGSLGAFETQAAYYELGSDIVGQLTANAGSSNYELGRLDANWYVAAGAEAWADLWVFYFDNGVVLTVEMQSGED